MSTLKEKKYFTIPEYLLKEQQSSYKSEYHNGQIFAMAGGSAIHSKISANIIAALMNALKGKNCSVYDSNLKVFIAPTHSFVYPDAMVICGKEDFLEDRTDIIQNPLLIIEVLSDGTEAYDRGEKFRKYRTLPSFREYVLIAQKQALVEVFYKKAENHWLIPKAEGIDQSIYLHSIDCSIALTDIYNRVVLNKL